MTVRSFLSVLEEDTQCIVKCDFFGRALEVQGPAYDLSKILETAVLDSREVKCAYITAASGNLCIITRFVGEVDNEQT